MNLIKQVEHKIEEVRAKLYEVRFPIHGAIDLNTSLTGTTSAKAGGRTIWINTLLARQNLNGFLEQTIPHEMAHLACDRHYPGAPAHGKQWAFIMLELGLEPVRCLSYDTSLVRRRPVDRAAAEHAKRKNNLADLKDLLEL